MESPEATRWKMPWPDRSVTMVRCTCHDWYYGAHGMTDVTGRELWQNVEATTPVGTWDFLLRVHDELVDASDEYFDRMPPKARRICEIPGCSPCPGFAHPVIEDKPKPAEADDHDGCYVACEFEVYGVHSPKCKISPLGERLNARPRRVEVCMVPDCGCSGDAHP